MPKLVARVALLCAFATAAAAQTPFPKFTGQRLYVADVPNVYEPLVEQIERLEDKGPQTYYVVVVRSTGRGQYATRDYLDEMYQVWQEQAAQQGLSIDPDRAVIIVLAMQNRQLAVRTGTLLQNEYGLRGQAIDRQLVQPHFIPHARAGNYLRGLQTLLTQIDRTIAARDEQVQRQKAEAAARAEELARSAQSAVDTARTLLADVRKELEAKQSAGLEVQSFQQQVQQAADRLEALKPEEGQHARVLRDATDVQKQLQSVQSRLHELTAQQEQAEALIQQVQQSAQRVQETLVQQRRKDLATEGPSSRLEEVWGLIDVARGSLAKRPHEALASAQQAGQRLAEIGKELAQLPVLKQQTVNRLAHVEQLRVALGKELEKAKSVGADTSYIEQALKELDDAHAEAKALAQADYREALAKIDALHTALAARQHQVAVVYQNRYFLTRTLPATSLGLVVLAASLVLGFLRWRHLRWRRRVGERLTAYRTEVTRWMERLDALKKQHQYLPITDEDFAQPMTGKTLELYKEVEDGYGRLRSVWLELMDRRTKAEGIFALERPLGIARLREVDALLNEPQEAPMPSQYQDAVEKLNLLNQAHEEAERARQAAGQLMTALQQQIDVLTEAGLPPAAIISARDEAQRQYEEADDLLTPDPLTASEWFTAVQAKLQELSTAASRRIACLEKLRAAQQLADEVRQQAMKHRVEGIRLVEKTANPDPLLESAAALAAEALAALEQEQDAQAESLVEQSRQSARQARESIERHLADKQFFHDQLPVLREALEGLRPALERAREEQRELEVRFHPDSWSQVSDNVQQGEQILDTLAEGLEKAAAHGQVQEFSSAAALLREAQAQREQVEALLGALSDCLIGLERLRQEATTRYQKLQQTQQQVAEYFREHERIVTPQASEAWSQAQAECRDVQAALDEPRPHWPRVVVEQEQAAQSLAAALAQAQQDVRHQAEFQEVLAQARPRAAALGSLLERHTADRPRANQRYRSAVQTLEAIAHSSEKPNAPWSVLLEEARQAAADLEQARQWAEEDIRLAEQAARALRAAETEFHGSRTFLSYGVTPNLSTAQSQLEQARQRLRAQDYEQAIALADAAEHAARQAHMEAVRMAEERRRRREAARRRRELERTMTTIVLSGMGRGRPFGGGFSSGGFSGSRSMSGGSRSSRSSWSSGTSQSSW